MFLMAEAAIKAKNLGTRHFTDTMQKAATIDFTNDFFQASGKGRTRIKHVLSLAMELGTLEDVPEGDRATYNEIVGATTRSHSDHGGEAHSPNP